MPGSTTPKEQAGLPTPNAATLKRPDISGPTISVEVFRIVLGRGILVPACDTATFHVHHKLLCANSAYFRAATANGERHVTFKTDDDPANFQIYVQWLYNQELKPELSKGGTVCTRLMRAYVLGELSWDACFQNAIIGATAQCCMDHRVVPTSAAINVTYHGTAMHSPARRLLLDLWVWTGGPSRPEINSLTDQVHPTFINDLLEGLLHQRPRPEEGKPWDAEPARYHVANYRR